ncbi:hypothetical protein XBLMG947_2355 [Xanthomonas bromi]|uniref:Uncharacterized protein n=1 Tax=Xanthomonas bromi TaxID=56449 RepID=A0A1C3NMD7_9XANT|nr:hypothetical protein XBLMG947_2355 [Xanthomonas bromi]
MIRWQRYDWQAGDVVTAFIATAYAKCGKVSRAKFVSSP